VYVFRQYIVEVDFAEIVPAAVAPAQVQQNLITLQLSNEQQARLMEFIRDQHWNEDVIRPNLPEENANDNQLENIRVNPQFYIPPGEGDKCKECFCTPCITNEANRQRWWCEENSEPANGNNSLRKACYYKFWTMMYHRGIWSLPDYIVKKEAALTGARANQNQPPVRIQREIMPKCVLTLVRTWHPNVAGIPYMGHKWS